MIREEKKIDQFILREAKGIKDMLKSGSISKDLVTFEIFVDNIMSDFQIDQSQKEYTENRSKEILTEKGINISGL
ncbi:hypothetical protein [Flammeovirga sp. EKP202]|uniref:hypothetical protein n=1 Tax=Flammeovirga sp. EKP202 TaxID=2770592 RepID=UPI00165EEF82|nr:hypothetical protein [Flammeovirga sp. EKP202]MBD0402170.1 hypothetical protein [Flammeovirga sp. EKP202]